MQLLNIGIGSKIGVMNFTQSLDTCNHIAADYEEDTISVQINTDR